MAKPTPEQIIESTLTIAHAILATDALDEHKRGFLSGCIWMITEANGKYGVPYWSEGVYNLVQKYDGNLKAVLKPRHPIRHEHVNPRKYVVEEVMKNPDQMEEILLKKSIACLVTHEEHVLLDHTDTGFARYKAAGIRVWDVETEDWLRIE